MTDDGRPRRREMHQAAAAREDAPTTTGSQSSEWGASGPNSAKNMARAAHAARNLRISNEPDWRTCGWPEVGELGSVPDWDSEFRDSTSGRILKTFTRQSPAAAPIIQPSKVTTCGWGHTPTHHADHGTNVEHAAHPMLAQTQKKRAVPFVAPHRAIPKESKTALTTGAAHSQP